MNDKRKRNINLNLKLTAEEKQALLSAVKKTQSKNITDYIVNVAKNTHCIVISEVEDYNDFYSKIGNLSNQIAKALNTIVKNKDKYRDIIHYLERNNNSVLNAMTTYSDKMQDILASYADYENQIEIKKGVLIKEYKNKMKA
jgi:hypothetical protein